MLNRLPGDSYMHQLSVATKLTALVALTLAIFADPRWQQLVAAAAVAALAAFGARVPPAAVPRLPAWYWVPLLMGLALANVGSGAGPYLRVVAISVVFLVLSMVISWTTDLGELAATLARVGRPLQRIGIPVTEWAIVTGLAVRTLPLLVDEFRTLLAARKLRPQPPTRNPADMTIGLIDLLTAAMAATIRRSTDMGTAITARGRATSRIGPLQLGWRDAVASVIIASACLIPSALAH